MNLVQHHGYPTPLLDWTYSPYIAAYFAYRGISSKQSKQASSEDKVRIYMFDQYQWIADWGHYNNPMINANLHISMGEYLAIDNDRVIPQQSASMVTNVDDLETFIKFNESIKNKVYLCAFDLPISERDKIMKDLRYMGITAGSMFPGLDGTCEELREQNFETL